MSMKSSIKIGDVFETNQCGLCTVIDYRNKYEVIVQFNDTGFIKSTFSKSLLRGCVKDPYVRSVFGVGYLAEGEPSKIGNKQTRTYILWKNMLARCYSESYHKRRPSYIGCEVCPRWHNYQNFLKDIKSLDGYEDWLDPSNNMALDKDTKFIGNKLYSIATCQFINVSDNVKDAMYRKNH